MPSKQTPPKKYPSVAVIGIGRVGLPLALVLADVGFTVYGIGRNQEKIDSINKGKMPFKEEGATRLLKNYVGKRFFAETDYSVVSKCDYIILSLGTPVDENINPVYDQINMSLAAAIPFLKKEQTLILRSTVSPRTTQYVKSLIEEETSFKIGRDFYLAFCPERITEGQSIEEIRTIPQIIGTIDKKSAKKSSSLFHMLGVETLITDDVSAELAKLFTNMYRYINFAIANEFMLLADNYHRDIYEIVNLVNHNYKRGGLRLPGMSAGPCLFKDGFFLVSDLPFADLISTSWKINEAIPMYLIKRIRERMKLYKKKAVILGLAFKAETDDPRASLSFKVLKALQKERAFVTLHDPYVTSYKKHPIHTDVYDALEGADLIFIGTNHTQYKNLDMKKIKEKVKKNCIVCDIWNVFNTNKIVYRLNSVEEF